jgi:hypothetical protein
MDVRGDDRRREITGVHRAVDLHEIAHLDRLVHAVHEHEDAGRGILDEQQIPAAVEVGDDAGHRGVLAECRSVGAADVGNAAQRSRPDDSDVGRPSGDGRLLARSPCGPGRHGHGQERDKP